MMEPILLFILPGAVGGLARGLVGIYKNVVEKGKKLNFTQLYITIFVSIVVGGLASVLTAGDWRFSILAGYAGTDLIESLYKTKLFSFFRNF